MKVTTNFSVENNYWQIPNYVMFSLLWELVSYIHLVKPRSPIYCQIEKWEKLLWCPSLVNTMGFKAKKVSFTTQRSFYLMCWFNSWDQTIAPSHFQVSLYWDFYARGDFWIIKNDIYFVKSLSCENQGTLVSWTKLLDFWIRTQCPWCTYNEKLCTIEARKRTYCYET